MRSSNGNRLDWGWGWHTSLTLRKHGNVDVLVHWADERKAAGSWGAWHVFQAYGDTLWLALAIAAWDDIVTIIGELVPLPS